MEGEAIFRALLAALGVGLLVGVVRERMHAGPALMAGTRTHALVGLLGCVAWMLGSGVFIAALLAVAGLTALAYGFTAREDPGLTGEIALLLTALLGGLAARDPALAAALGVLMAILLQAKVPMQKLSREWISEKELQDALMLGAAALVVMPLLSRSPIDPWGAVSPLMVWRIVVLVMAVGMLGHVAQRLFGARWGLSIAGFFAGFASSTAAVSGMGQRARAEPAHTRACAAAALLANLASLLLFVAVVGAVSPALLQTAAGSLVGAGLALLGVVALLWRRAQGVQTQAAAPTGRAFQPSQALWIAALIAGVSLLAAWLGARYGSAGVLASTMLVALAEVHAAAAGVAQMAANGVVPLEVAHWGVLGVLASSSLAKSALAFASGGARYGVLVTGGLLALVAGGVLGQLW
ncbi:DUF4010 domain-containing protein [Comamonas sp. CMM01]|jgi:uncharacterized membrane protein (DUF4010 family)|uniref:MgtC/SapB family protein n=1 Tax=Comamonas sp. CMM01 TaxID=2769280 RepID=UPI001781979D|nr:DUF4010 domain-containing protein [Comamonas sp. CMM01]MBD9532730.1 DUF4010 domain-containing protein [Comamonas sp. CMM01]